MFSGDFFQLLLNLDSHWKVSSVDVDMGKEEVEVSLEFIGERACCPITSDPRPIYDRRPVRRWRHLDTLQYKTFICCRVPRVRTTEGIRSVKVPWAGDNERHTFLFERLAIDLLLASKNQTRTAKILRCGFDVVNRIIHLSVERGLHRRQGDKTYKHICLDEKSFRKGHSYVSVLSDPVEGNVIDLVEGRKKESAIELIKKCIVPGRRRSVQTVSVDMWKAYMGAVHDTLPTARLVHDRFHLIRYLNDGVDKVRRREVKREEELKNTRFIWLKNKMSLTDEQTITFEHLTRANYEVSRAWRIKENFRSLIGRPDVKDAFGMLIDWCAQTIRSGIREMIKVANMFKSHMSGVANAMVESASNAMAERLNGKIQLVKTTARGYRTFKNFRSAVLFFNGGLSLYPHNSR